MVSMDDNILAAVGCVSAVHHDTYLHQLLLLVTRFVAKEDRTHIYAARDWENPASRRKFCLGILCLSHPPRPQGRRHTR
jgi:hypothetical protein